MSDLRALDREVAENVMGLVVCKRTLDAYLVDPGYPEGSLGGDELPIPRYSSDPSAMMEVIEKMREKGWDAAFSTVIVKGQWHVAFVNDNDLFDAEASALPEAVCRAALQARTTEKG